MRILELSVESFRAIRQARVTLGPTTVLFGENDCGRSSLFEALALALGWNADDGAFAFQPYHFRRSAGVAEQIRIEILLEGGSTLSARLEPRTRFVVTVLEKWDGAIETQYRFAREDGSGAADGDAKILKALRRRMPVFKMGELGAAPPQQVLQSGDPTAEAVTRFEKHYRHLIHGTGLDLSKDLELGFAAAKEVLAHRGKQMRVAADSLDPVLMEIAGKSMVSERARHAKPMLSAQGASARKIGALVVMGSLLAGWRQEASKDSEPLVILEDPEAHMHPMTLAVVSDLIAHIPGQKVIGTHSGTILAGTPLRALRRLTRQDGVVREWKVPERGLSRDDLRRYTYHVRSRRGQANFARCWLLVEGETEFWLMRELASILGYDLGAEGVVCVEFAQCGLEPLIRVATHLGIEWHLLADGDHAGQSYAATAAKFCRGQAAAARATVLRDLDVEHCFWNAGYRDVFLRAAYPSAAEPPKVPAKTAIRRAIEKRSKPYMAVELLEAVSQRGPGGVPAPIRQAIERCIAFARNAPGGRA